MKKSNRVSTKASEEHGTVVFPDDYVFIRPATEGELENCAHGSDQPFYTLVGHDGLAMYMVCGPPKYAFNSAKEEGFTPVWMH